MADSIDVIEMFKQAAFEVDNRRLPELKADTVIATLGMDSVAVMELVSYFEEKLRVRIPDEELSKFRTVRDLRDTIARLAPDKQFAAERGLQPAFGAVPLHCFLHPLRPLHA